MFALVIPRSSDRILLALALTTGLHLWTAAAGLPRLPFHLVCGLGWGGWLLCQVRTRPEVLREWGFRVDNLGAAALPAAGFTALTAAVLLAWGLVTRAAFPLHALLPLAVYPLWGVAQQFFLQGILLRALRELEVPAGGAIAIAAVLFAGIHLPYGVPLVILSGLLAAATSALWLRTPNLWVLGAVHGWLGTLAFYGVLHRDALGVVVEGL